MWRETQRSLTLASISMVCLLAGGCLDHRCGADLEYVDGVCVEKTPPTTDQGADTTQADGSPADLVAGDASLDAIVADSGPAADTGAITGLGGPCKTNAECKGAADYCAVQPPATMGYCTITGCDPKVLASCPSGYYCFDLSIFDPKLPKICVKK